MMYDNDQYLRIIDLGGLLPIGSKVNFFTMFFRPPESLLVKKYILEPSYDLYSLGMILSGFFFPDM